MADNYAKIVKKNKVGRPTVITDEVVAKLEAVLKLGVTDDVACDYAEINPATFYRHLASDENFARKIRQAKNYARIAAGNVVLKAIIEGNDVQTAKWWLEKKYPNEFGGTANLNLGVQVNIKQEFNKELEQYSNEKQS